MNYPTDTPGRTGMGYQAPPNWWNGKDLSTINAALRARAASKAFWWATPPPHVGPMYAGAHRVVQQAHEVAVTAPPPQNSPVRAAAAARKGTAGPASTISARPQMSFFGTLGKDLAGIAPIIGGAIAGPAGAAIGAGVSALESSHKPALPTTSALPTVSYPQPGSSFGGVGVYGASAQRPVTVGPGGKVTTGQTVLPAVGSALGAIIGDVPGAIAGGALGEGAATALDSFLSSRGSGKTAAAPVGVQPTVRGHITDANGKTNPILRCPRGYVLAFNNVCYPKQMLPKKWRKWKPEPRPVVSRRDQKAIRRADAARKRLVKLTKESGAYAAMHKPKSQAKD